MAVSNAMTPAELHPEHPRHWEHTAAFTTELILALGAVVLGILGLVGLFPTELAAIAVIALGVMLLSEGASIMFRAYALLAEAGAGETLAVSEVSRAITAEFLAGVAGVVLGILALVGIAPLTLVSVAVIAYGAMLMVSSGGAIGFDWPAIGENERVRRLVRSLRGAAADAQLLVGLAAVVLGILGLIGIKAVTLVLVALLAIGAAALLRSSAVGGAAFDFMRR
jgi:hypothetical protein